MKAQADNKRRDVSYSVGDWVYVKLIPYRQTSLSDSHYHKLSKRYYGPFQITETINVVTYRLALPPSSKIHNVFHYSILKPHHTPIIQTMNPLPPRANDNHPHPRNHGQLFAQLFTLSRKYWYSPPCAPKKEQAETTLFGRLHHPLTQRWYIAQQWWFC